MPTYNENAFRGFPQTTPPHRCFLVVDGNPDTRSLLSRTLARKFPGALLSECVGADEAVEVAASERWDAIVVHRPFEMSPEAAVRELRVVAPCTPIVLMTEAGIEPAVEAGASTFLEFDAWLMLGPVVADLLQEVSRNPSCPES